MICKEIQVASEYMDWVEQHPEAPGPILRMKLDEMCEGLDQEHVYMCIRTFIDGVVVF